MKRMKKSVLTLTAALTILLSLAACGGGGQDAPEPEAKETPTPIESVAPVAEDTAAGDREFWNQDWYGVWVVIDGEGVCEQFVGMENSCCATIFIEESGEGMFLSWDYTGNREDYDSQLCNTMLTLQQAEGRHDYLETTSGRFWDDPLPEDWLILHASDLEGWETYEDAIVVTNEYHVDDGENVGQFEYIIFLRPWGTDWSDLEAENPHMLPPDYTEWYLPQLEAGEPMPDSFE